MSQLNVLMIGDVVGQAGKYALSCLLPGLISRYNAHYTIVNGENIAGGKGITANLASKIFSFGADVITTGNHIWKNRDVLKIIESETRLLRPVNYPDPNPGRGFGIYQKEGLPSLAVINLMGRLNLLTLDCPFRKMDDLLEHEKSIQNILCRVVDFHAETSSEKIAMGWHLNGRVSAVCGTHTHVQTADNRVLDQGTAYISDLGMTGPHDSVLGVEKDLILKHFISGLPVPFKIAEKNLCLNGIYLKIDGNSGQALETERISEKVQDQDA